MMCLDMLGERYLLVGGISTVAERRLAQEWTYTAMDFSND